MSNEQRAVNEKSDILLTKAEAYAHAVYGLSRELPKYEQFGLTSQLRRAALSVPLNIVEGFARRSKKTQIQFLNIAYGSLKETQFILIFAAKEEYVNNQTVKEVYRLGDEVGRIIWSKTITLKKQLTHEK